MQTLRTSIRVGLGLLLGLALLPGCGPPTGPDLVSYSCVCFDQASNENILLPARICTDVDDEEKLRDDAQSQCDRKESLCFPTCIKIENCGFVEDFFQEGVCPEGSSPEAGGDFGQSLSVATASSVLDIFGGDVDDFSVAPDDLVVRTTQTGDTLEFSDIAGFVGQVNFSTPGGFLGIGGGSHTLTDLNLFLISPFSVDLEPDGSFVIPDGAGDLIVSARLDGDDTALAGTTRELTGIYDEELGLFTLSGEVDAEGADVVIGIDLELAFENRPPRARAGSDQTLECSAANGTAVAMLSGLDSFDLDGDDDIARYSWTVDLGVPSPQQAIGSEVQVALGLGMHVITLAVADQSGSFGVDSLDAIVEDTTGPVIDIVQPAAVQYPHSDLLVLDYGIADTCIDVADSSVLLDGAGMSAGHGLADGQPIDLLIELALGPHSFSIESVDELGNRSMREVIFEVIATPASLMSAVERFSDEGAIADPGITTALLEQLAAAAGAGDAGHWQAAAAIYRAFESLVEAQAGRMISPGAASILVTDVQAVAAACQ